MSMPENEIQAGWIYATNGRQERLVLGRDRDGLVVYVSKGSTDGPPFHNCHARSTVRQFAQRAVSKLRFVDDLRPFIIANKATTVVVRTTRK